MNGSLYCSFKSRSIQSKESPKTTVFGGEFTSDDGFCVAASFQMFEAVEDTQNQRWRRK